MQDAVERLAEHHKKEREARDDVLCSISSALSVAVDAKTGGHPRSEVMRRGAD